LGHCSYNIIV